MHRATLLIAAASLATLPLAAQQTVAESTGAANTSTHADVIAFIDSLEARGARLHVGVLGTSPQGREIQWLVASRPLVTTPGEARRSGKPVFYIQANIHGGEVEGKEAMQRLLRDLTIGDLQPLLDSVIILACDGARVVVDPISLGFVRGSEIDFVDELIGAQFKINNPNVSASCGCGTSFSI